MTGPDSALKHGENGFGDGDFYLISFVVRNELGEPFGGVTGGLQR